MGFLLRTGIGDALTRIAVI